MSLNHCGIMLQSEVRILGTLAGDATGRISDYWHNENSMCIFRLLSFGIPVYSFGVHLPASGDTVPDVSSSGSLLVQGIRSEAC